ncbi:MAG: TetR family transcriptional regulator C-terminal domain-containing protein [Methylophaga sp.]|nr:TetR family transcriptional regulator C-terminal domain-containing protein [Methylophaga sp.]
MTRVQTRKLLIDVGTQVIGSQGFNPTGLNTVLQTAGVPKGSFYYYFASKEDFGLAIIDETATEYAELIAGYLQDQRFTPLTRIHNYLQSGLERIREGQCKRGCLIGTLGQELSSQNETFRARLDAVFEGWKQQFGQCLQAAKACGELAADVDVIQLAEFLLSGWQGAILRAKMQQNIAPLEAFISLLFLYVLTNRQAVATA